MSFLRFSNFNRGVALCHLQSRIVMDTAGALARIMTSTPYFWHSKFVLLAIVIVFWEKSDGMMQLSILLTAMSLLNTLRVTCNIFLPALTLSAPSLWFPFVVCRLLINMLLLSTYMFVVFALSFLVLFGMWHCA